MWDKRHKSLILWAGVICCTVLFFFQSTAWADWTQQNSGTSNDLNDVHFVDANTGYAVGGYSGMGPDDEEILKTTDGGTTWNSQTSGNNEILNGVYFTSANLGYAVGNNGTIIKTTNGGSNWNTQNSGTMDDLNDVHFVDDNTGYAVGGYSGMGPDDEEILKTTDGGTTWNSQTSGNNEILNGVYFTTANFGYAVGENGTILKTTNGGSNWSTQTSGTSDDLDDVYFVSANIGWAVGDDGIVLKTTNGGNSWNPQTSGTVNDLRGVYFTDAGIGYAVGNNGTILKTTDGGTTWNAQASGTNERLNSVFFVDANTGWAVGNNGIILKTADGGGSPSLFITKLVWEENGSAPLFSPVTAPVGSTLVFLIYVKNTTASPVADVRIADILNESGFQYVVNSMVRTDAASPPLDTANELDIFNATDPGTGTALTDAVDGDVASAQDTGGPADPDRITIGAVTGQANGSLTIAGNTTFAVRIKVKVK